jgi:hypothetical protein
VTLVMPCFQSSRNNPNAFATVDTKPRTRTEFTILADARARVASSADRCCTLLNQTDAANRFSGAPPASTMLTIDPENETTPENARVNVNNTVADSDSTAERPIEIALPARPDVASDAASNF